METRALPDLRLRQRNRHVRRGDLRGHIRLCRSHHPRRRVLPYLPRHWWYFTFHPPHQLWLISFVAPPSASHLISDHPWLTGHKWTWGPKPCLLSWGFSFRKESLWIYLLFILFSICILLTMDYTCSLAKSGNECVISQHADLCSDTTTGCNRAYTRHVSQNNIYIIYFPPFPLQIIFRIKWTSFWFSNLMK